MITAERLDERFIRSHLILNFLYMIEVISERAVDVTQCDGGYLRHDPVWSQALMLVPDNDVLHAHAVACVLAITQKRSFLNFSPTGGGAGLKETGRSTCQSGRSGRICREAEAEVRSAK